MLRQLEEQARHQAFQEDRASIITSLEPGEGWSWCYVDEIRHGARMSVETEG